VKHQLDEVDVAILKLLQADGRITNADLAQKVALSPPSVLQRVRGLEKIGLIKGYHAVIDFDRLGFKVVALVQVTLSLHQEQPIERFRKAILDIPEIVECYHVTGEFDFLLKVVVKDIRSYEILVRERISKIKGLSQIKTSFVLSTPKLSQEIEF